VKKHYVVLFSVGTIVEQLVMRGYTSTNRLKTLITIILIVFFLLRYAALLNHSKCADFTA
jgi:hypothetical protein